MTILGPIPVEDDLIRCHGLTISKGGGDWHLTAEGDIGLTRDGDFPVGDQAVNGMCRLMGAWRCNDPTMRLLFGSIVQMRSARTGLEQDLDPPLRSKTPWVLQRTPEQLAAYHAANDALMAGGIGCGSLSGSLVLLIATFLGRFRADVQATEAEWKFGLPQIGEQSIGRIVWAAANAFRHVDDWAEARHKGAFEGRQKASMSVLRAALNPNSLDILDRVEWEVAMDVLSGGEFDVLTGKVLRFANDVALKVRGRPPAPG
jgi:hypothetical protein